MKKNNRRNQQLSTDLKIQKFCYIAIGCLCLFFVYYYAYTFGNTKETLDTTYISYSEVESVYRIAVRYTGEDLVTKNCEHYDFAIANLNLKKNKIYIIECNDNATPDDQTDDELLKIRKKFFQNY